MSRANVEQSLDAVERALSHFVASLDRAGFAEGSDAYRQMADVILGQWLWVQENGARDLEPRIRRIAELADRVAADLLPYVEVMRRLGALRALLAERWGVEPGTTAAEIVEALVTTGRPMSTTEVVAATSSSTSIVRRELLELVTRDVVTKTGDRRPRYTLAEPSPERVRRP